MLTSVPGNSCPDVSYNSHRLGGWERRLGQRLTVEGSVVDCSGEGEDEPCGERLGMGRVWEATFQVRSGGCASRS